MSNPTPEPTPNPTPEPTPDPKLNEAPGRTFTQEEVNSFLAAEKRKIQDSDDIKAGKAAIRRLADLEEASKSEAQKLADRAAAAEAERDRMTGQLRTALIRSEFMRLAADKHMSAMQIADAFALADQSGIEVSEAGVITGTDRALEAVLKDRPHLAGQPPNGQNGQRAAPNINAGGRNDTPSRDQRIEQTQKELQQSGRYGRL